jgi:hypothetical protein
MAAFGRAAAAVTIVAFIFSLSDQHGIPVVLLPACHQIVQFQPSS